MVCRGVLRSSCRYPTTHCLHLLHAHLAGSYETTIHAINSAVLKLSKLTYVSKIYRGSQGATLPKAFFVANEFNVKGGVDVRFANL